MKRVLITLLLLFVSAGPLVAQETEPAGQQTEPAVQQTEPAGHQTEPAAQQPGPAAQQAGSAKPYLESKENYQVFVIGDSLAAGLWSGLTRMASGDARLAIDGRYKEDSGLARPEYYDWNEALPKILERNRIDIAVVMIGTNDSQQIRDGDARYAFGTPDWNRLYAQQTDRLIKSLKDAGAVVYWVELPPMASPEYEADIKAISAIHAERANAAGVKLIGTRGAFATEGGAYTDRGFDIDGQFVRLRSRDGVHFLKDGNNKVASLVLDAIRADIEAADGKQQSATAAPEGPSANGPVFGQETAEGGETITYLEAPQPEEATDPRLAKTDFAGRVQQIVPSNPGLAELAKTVTPGSSAARLFTLGEIPPPKPGRFDDFRMTQ